MTQTTWTKSAATREDVVREWVIYALIDPRFDTVRYVGWTINLKVRIRDHLKASRLSRSTRRDKWLRELLASGEKPRVEILERGVGEWGASEMKWIAHFRDKGCELTNHTDGGEGTLGRRHTDAARAAMSTKRKGRKPSQNLIEANRAKKGIPKSQETRERMSLAMKGRPKSPAHRLSLSLAKQGVKASESARAKMSESRAGVSHGPMSQHHKIAIRAAWTEEKKLAGSLRIKAFWASISPEQRSNIALKSARSRLENLAG